MSYSVTRRHREIAIRIAVGAQLQSVQQLIVGWGMLLTSVALVIGLPAAWMMMKFSSSFIYGVHPHDAVSFTVAPLCLAGVALIACWIPARRAAKVNLQILLRSE
jgi:ABC-type lipoprotein release transport system permease subunit